MRKDIVSIDSADRQPKFYRRYAINSLAIALGDAFVMAASLCIANLLLYWIKDIPFSVKYGFLLVPLWTVASLAARLLPGWGLGVVDELRRIEGTLFIVFVSLLLVSFFTKKSVGNSRIIFISTYVFSAIWIPFIRAAARGFVIRLGAWGVPVSIYGDRESAAVVIAAMRSEPGLGYIPSAIFTDSMPQGNMIQGIPVLGNLHNTTYRTPVAIVALGQTTRHQLVDILEGPLEVYRRVIMIPDLQEAPSLWVTPRDLQGILGLEITKNLLNPFARVLKRLSDLFLVVGTSPVWVPLMMLLYLLIWLEDRHNPIFLQRRVGMGGGLFRTAKFRTMVPDAENVLQQALKKDPALRAEWEANFKLKKDPRITKVGIFLRKTSLDEIPQLLNVLKGTMSLVGPRPLPAYHFNELSEQVRFLRHKVQPGITGLWQVSGRSEAGNEGMEKWDPYYVRNWSIWLDLVIMARTFKAVFCCRGAY